MPLNIEGYEIRNRDVRLYEQTSIVRSGLVLNLDASIFNTVTYNGTWIDLSGNQINSTLNNGPTFSSTSNTISFDGVNDYAFHAWPASFDYDDNTSPRSWEVFVKPNSTMNLAGIFGHKAGSSCSWYCNGGIFLYGGKWTFNWYDNAAYQFLNSNVSATSGVFAHIVGTFGTDSIPRIYVNGELKATFGSTTNMNYSSGMNYYEYGYNSKNGGQHYFNGEFGVIRFYNTTLTAAQVAHNYNVTKGRFGL